jgi:hypothetical protein
MTPCTISWRMISPSTEKLNFGRQSPYLYEGARPQRYGNHASGYQTHRTPNFAQLLDLLPTMASFLLMYFLSLPLIFDKDGQELPEIKLGPEAI